MNSYDSLNNFKYLGKIAIIMLIVFLILKYAINLRPVEAVLLSAIIAVSVLIIENIIFINNEATDPLNCDQCKVQQVKENTQNTTTSSNSYDNSNSNSNSYTNSGSNENFGVLEDLKDDIKNYTNILIDNSLDSIKNISITPQSNSKENFASIEHPFAPHLLKEHKDKVLDTKYANIKQENPSEVSLDNYIEEQAEKNVALLQDKYIENNNKPTELPADSTLNTTFETKPSDNIKKLETDVKNEYNALLTDQNKIFIDDRIPSMNINDITVPRTVTKGDPIQGPSVSFDESYVQYQQNGLEKLDELESLKTNIFRASIGDQKVVQEFLKDANKYNQSIYSYSTDAPKTYEALNSELKYGDYNYIGPLNKGMINKEYTFISPTNWYPIPPVPPVCVTNKSCTTCPIQITDGKDYMNFASLEDFDKARRFTGDMRININYIKDVLNNPNGY
jgi:hypothetical protein